MLSGVGYYIHHHGRGHLHRASAIAAALGGPVTGLSSLPRPAAWNGDWVDLPLDVPEGAAGGAAGGAAPGGRGGAVRVPPGPVGVAPGGLPGGLAGAVREASALRREEPRPVDPTANGRLHWVPLGVDGLRERAAVISAWIARAHPRVIVSDVSVEVALLARLHGVPVVTVALPGIRDDPAHALGFDISAAIIAAWPDEAEGMVTGLSDAAAARLHPVGAISRYPFGAGAGAPPAGTRRRALVLAGAGGDGFTPDAVAAARAATPGWEITHLGGSSGAWVADPRDAVRASDVVITHAGQNAIADVAAARRPAIVVPQARPHDEQAATGRVLAAGDWPAIVVPRLPDGGWGDLLDAAHRLDGSVWRAWNDGGGAARAAEIITRVMRGGVGFGAAGAGASRGISRRGAGAGSGGAGSGSGGAGAGDRIRGDG
ncbi:glycosyltransferase [Microbacterium sp. cx-59]|uniref:glycosyltransferase n=1 Tax=Microbacterium sp. cx-59 TaxID=2891207 RepID=UPI001E2F40DC|nr:glycosyltransferase [Microbacterium sp. cx-59]MCC4908051.1 hypothetical protein [Microbacterium sp. cx-59]